MKRILFVLMAVLLLAGQIVSPVAAGVEGVCGDTYTVVRGDTLSKIAQKCQVSYASIVSANPEIKNVNLIYAGQVIRLKADTSIPVTGGTYVVVKGDYLSKIAKAYGTTVAELLRVNPQIKNASLIYVGQVINLPSGTTTGGGTTGTNVSLSVASAKPGAAVTIKVWGFPANADIDLRVGIQNAAYSLVIDRKTDAKGEDTYTFNLPATAKAGEKWVVKVQTTSLAKGMEVTSPVITITN